MSYDHKGPADVLIASRHLGVEPDERLNESVQVTLAETDTPTVARLAFDSPLTWPAHPNHVRVTLPNGSQVGGAITDLQRPADGPGWVTFSLDDEAT